MTKASILGKGRVWLTPFSMGILAGALVPGTRVWDTSAVWHAGRRFAMLGKPTKGGVARYGQRCAMQTLRRPGTLALCCARKLSPSGCRLVGLVSLPYR